jgi:hypothetical protein
MARFPFEEDLRFRFGAFHELVRRYIPIGREPPPEPRPTNSPAAGRHSTPRRERSRPPATRRDPITHGFAIHAGSAT